MPSFASRPFNNIKNKSDNRATWAQDLLEGLHIPAGQGTPQGPPGGAAGKEEAWNTPELV